MLALGALLFLAVVVTYAPALDCGFIWDDDDYVQGNLALRTWQGLWDIWFRLGTIPQYYPLTHTSFWLEYQLWGLDPAGYHATNIVMHAASCLVLWRVLAALDVPGAFFIALVFGLHPVHVESVVWITERKNVLSGLCYLLSFWAWLRCEGFVATRRSPRLWLTLSFALYVLSLFAKTVTCTLPAVMLLVLWWKRGSPGVDSIRRLLPFFCIGWIMGIFTISYEKLFVGAAGSGWELNLMERSLIAGRALTFYVGKLVWPTNLTFFYERWDVDASAPLQYVFPSICIAVIAALALQARSGRRGPLTGALFFCGTLSPALGFVDIYPMRFSFVADHFQYLASIGVLSLLVAAGAQAPFRRPIKILAAGAIALVLAGLIRDRIPAYRNLETLWRDTIVKNPASSAAHNNLGTALAERGDFDAAWNHYRIALELDPEDADILNNLGNAHGRREEYEEAIRYYRRALAIDPKHQRATYNLDVARARLSDAFPRHDGEQ